MPRCQISTTENVAKLNTKRARKFTLLATYASTNHIRLGQPRVSLQFPEVNRYSLFRNEIVALAGVAQWTASWPVNQKVSRLFNSQSGHMPGLQTRFPVGDALEAITY